jgi:hypothetical protein
MVISVHFFQKIIIQKDEEVKEHQHHLHHKSSKMKKIKNINIISITTTIKNPENICKIQIWKTKKS